MTIAMDLPIFTMASCGQHFVEDLIQACKQGSCAQVDRILRALADGCCREVVDSVGKGHWTALTTATAFGRHEIVRMLLRFGCNPDQVVKETTALEISKQKFLRTGRACYLMITDLLSNKPPLPSLEDYQNTLEFKHHPTNVLMEEIEKAVQHMKEARCCAVGCKRKVCFPYNHCGGRGRCLSSLSHHDPFAAAQEPASHSTGPIGQGFGGFGFGCSSPLWSPLMSCPMLLPMQDPDTEANRSSSLVQSTDTPTEQFSLLSRTALFGNPAQPTPPPPIRPQATTPSSFLPTTTPFLPTTTPFLPTTTFSSPANPPFSTTTTPPYSPTMITPQQQPVYMNKAIASERNVEMAHNTHRVSSYNMFCCSPHDRLIDTFARGIRVRD